MPISFNPRKLFADVDKDCPVLIAVSGGGDSVALLHLASSWAKAVGADLKVVTVDHGLRPEAAAEAAYVSGLSELLDLQHFTLAWEGLKPSSGLAEAARDARYLLMAEFARDIGAHVILTGHTLDDQAETVWMRNARYGSDNLQRGLSGMATTMILEPDIRVVRPLLDVRREQLRDYLREIGQTWIEDPTNMDTSYERVRARIALAECDLDPRSISRFARICGQFRKHTASIVRDFLSEELTVDDRLRYFLRYDRLRSLATSEQKSLAVRVVCAFAGGRNHFISQELAEAILSLEPGKRMTAGSCVIENQSGYLSVYREMRNMPLVQVPAGEKRIWDGRLLIDNLSKHSVVCRAAELEDYEQLESTSEVLKGAPRTALRTVPVISGNKNAVYFPMISGCPMMENVKCTLVVPAIERFCPDHDFPLMELVDLVRAEFALTNR